MNTRKKVSNHRRQRNAGAALWPALNHKGNERCPLSPILASLVVVRLLQPINNALRQRAAERLANGITHDDGRGGITNLLGFIDDISTVVPLEDLLFLCQQFRDRGLSLGCFINPDKRRILTSTNGTSPFLLFQPPTLA